MASHPNIHVHSAQARASDEVDVEVATATMTSTLQSMRISVPSMVPLNSGVRGTSVSLSIPLDEHHAAERVGYHQASTAGHPPPPPNQTYRRREPIRRDSLKRREALLKGKEGSRRRQRWENDRLLSNPYAQPPLPSDWEIRPTYPRHGTVPYYLAPLWDEKQKQKQKLAAMEEQQRKRREGAGQEQARVPRELRQKFKRAKGARGLLQELELEIRKFVEEWQRRGGERQKEVDADMDMDSEDEEIVFVGRNGSMSDRPPPSRSKTAENKSLERDHHKLILDSPANDRGGAFGRYLVHTLASYYGLRTWSVTVDGNPARKEAYVGIHERWERERQRSAAVGGGDVGGEIYMSKIQEGLPRPLWGIV